MSGDNSVLTAHEIEEIEANITQSKDKWRLFKKLAQLRMRSEDAEHVNDIMTKLSGNLNEFTQGRVRSSHFI